MNSNTSARAARCALLGLVLAAAAVAQDGVVTRAPERFEQVLWCSDAAAGAAVAKARGFSAVQLGRGVDPAPIVQQGLGFYLDQPIGKGLLELRDEQWQPVRDAYESTRDPATLVRPGCLRTPGVVAKAAEEAATEARRVAGPGLRFVALADEPSATRHDAPLDTCRCEHCLAAFRTFLGRRFPNVDAANEALGSHFTSFADVLPPTVDQLRRRELGDTALPKDLRPFALWLDFVDEQYAATVRTMADAVRLAVPGVPVGITGLQTPAAFGGTDYARFADALSLFEPYPVAGAPELVRSLAPRGSHHYATLSPPDAVSLGAVSPRSFVHAQVAAMACAGLAGVVVWNDGTIADAQGKDTAFGAAVAHALRSLAPALDACAGATVVPSDVWVVESQASVRVWWMLDSARDGMTWVRRFPSYERTHSTSQAARLAWLRLLQDLGMQPRFVTENVLPERLLRERPRCLVLPATIALADRTAQAIATYVKNGGVVLADHSTGLYDGSLRRRDAGALDELFGIRERSLAVDDQWVQEGASVSRERGLPLAERGLRGELGEPRSAGDAHVERTVERGRAIYLNAPVVAYANWRLNPAAVEPARDLRRRVRAVLHSAGVDPVCEVRGEGLPTCIDRSRLLLRDGRTVLAIRVNALDAPAVLQQLANAPARALRLELAKAATLRRLDGDVVGEGKGFDVHLDPFGALFFEVVR